MGEKIIVGPINKGLTTGVTPFNIDNDSFPYLLNAYQWRGRVKRKRGTALLGRLRRFFNSSSVSYSATATIALTAGSVNLMTGFSLQANGTIVPGSVTITDTTSGNVYTDPAADGVLVGAPGGSGTINYGTSVITIAAGAANLISVIFNYYPSLPVMGLEDLVLRPTQFPGTLAYDTKYAYNILTTYPYSIYDVSFYKNPPSGAYPAYVQKTNPTPTSWNGQTYQQFWTTNYQGAHWATNGVPVPFTSANIGMQFKPITGVTIITAGNGTTIPAVADLTIVAHGLVQGDFLFINEVVGITGINWQTGYVTSADPQAANVVRVTFPYAILGGAYVSGGIAQYLTNRSNPAIDCIRWYDGDPTDANVTNPMLNQPFGWVNFMPPLSLAPFSISDLPPRIYYLVGAKMILPFKDRLLFIGPVVQASSGPSIYLQDTVIYSQNGTPYYTASYFNTPNAAVDNPVSPTNFYNQILVPVNQTATPNAYFEDQTGFGGFATAAVDQPITTAAPNQDVIIMGLSTIQVQFVYTSNDLQPFNFYLVNSELGSGATFSSIIMDKAILTWGTRGYVAANQTGAERIDPQIPDQAFQVSLSNNGPERFTAQRDFINEWVYFTYPSNMDNDTQNAFVFPSETLFYNYRDNSYAIFGECYTTYGQFRKQTGQTWATLDADLTWDSWNTPWNSGISTLLTPLVIGGNQQGFVLFRDSDTNESASLYIQSISGSTITSPNHGLQMGDYITISGALGTVGAQINGKIFSVGGNVFTDTFVLNPTIPGGTYLGSGVIKRMYVPYIQTKQFPVAWGMGRKTRLGVQQYLLSTTKQAEITLLIFLNEDANNPYNDGPIVPDVSSINNSLIYSTVLYTCPESTNLGLTPANVNLQMPTARSQSQIWHRINTSLLGDTVQVGFTMSDAQMRAIGGPLLAITGATRSNPSVLTVVNDFVADQVVEIRSIVGMTELNNNNYIVISATPTTVTIDVDSTSFTAYISGGTINAVGPNNQFAEIELHGFILDVSPSMLLC